MGFLKSLMDLFSTETAKPQPTANTQTAADTDERRQNYNVTGISHYTSNILKLATKNPAYALSKKEIIAKKLYDQKIFEYTFAPQKTELIPEPTNPHDPNAIKVVIDGQLVGYVKTGSCARILKLIKENRIARIDGEIYGGNYKMFYDGELLTEKGNFKVRISIVEQ